MSSRWLAPVTGMAVALLLLSGRREVPVLDPYLPAWFYSATLLLPAAAVLTYWLFRREGLPPWENRHRLGFGLALAFGLWLAISLAWTPAPNYGGQKVYEFLCYTLPGLALTMLVLGVPRARWWFLGTWAAFALLLALLGAVEHWGRLNDVLTGERMTSLGAGYNVYGRYTGLGALVMLGAVGQVPGLLGWVMTVAGFLALTAATVLSGSRGAMGAEAAAVMLAAPIGFYAGALDGARVVLRRYVVLVVVLCVAAGGTYGWLMMLFPPAPDMPRLPNLGVVRRWKQPFQEKKGKSIGDRIVWYQQSVELAKTAPVVGRGAGAFAMLVATEDRIRYPHNVGVELYLETGAVGTALVVGLAVLVTGHMLWSLRRPLPWTGVICWALFVFAVAAAQVSGDIYDNRLIWSLAGAVLAHRPTVESGTP